MGYLDAWMLINDYHFLNCVLVEEKLLYDPVGRLVGWLVGRSVGRLVGRSVGRSPF